MSETYPGNVRVIEKKLTESSLFGAASLPRHGDLMLFGFGITSKWAVLVKNQFDGFEDGDVEVGVTQPIRMNSGVFVPAFELARGALRTGEPGDYIEEQPAMRSTYELRWEPGDWNCIDLIVMEVDTVTPNEGGQQGGIRMAERFRFQGDPLVSEGQSNDAMEWPRLPKSTQGSTVYPNASYNGEPLNQRWLVVIPVFESGYDPYFKSEQNGMGYPGPRNEAILWNNPVDSPG
jgi:hypothetical protein